MNKLVSGWLLQRLGELVPSTFETKCTLSRFPMRAQRLGDHDRPRSEPPIPMFTTSVMALP